VPKAARINRKNEENMNREMRRLMEREERLQKQQGGSGPGGRQPRRTRPGSGGLTPGGPTVERKSIFRRLLTFLHEVRQELKKVSWPSREQMIAFTTVTLIVTVSLTLVVFALDVGMKEAVISLLQRRS
jgi:preprotein translocase subunit SecE